MLARHKFKIHAECPMVNHKQWDYYTVTIQTEDVIDVHYLESVMNSVRGLRATQEDIAEVIKQQLGCESMVEIRGQHSQSSTTTIYR